MTVGIMRLRLIVQKVKTPNEHTEVMIIDVEQKTRRVGKKRIGMESKKRR